MEAATRVEAVIVVPRTHLWVEVSALLWLEETIFVPLSKEDADTLRFRGLSYYLTTGNRK